jgi:hypothetical protein
MHTTSGLSETAPPATEVGSIGSLKLKRRSPFGATFIAAFPGDVWITTGRAVSGGTAVVKENEASPVSGFPSLSDLFYLLFNGQKFS